MNTHKRSVIRQISALNHGFVSTKDIRTKGIDPSYLLRMEAQGLVSRVKRGLYRFNDDQVGYDEWTEVSSIVPHGVFCLQSALVYHELTTQNPLQYYVAIERDAYKPVLPPYPPIKLVFLSGPRYYEGIQEIKEAGRRFRVYDIDKTICDCILRRKTIGYDVLKEALKLYVIKREKNINQLMRYARLFRAEQLVKGYLEVLLWQNSLESVVAEKFEVMISLGEINSRMKDFYDIYLLSGTYAFDGRTLQEAVFETLQRWGTSLERDPIIFQDAFRSRSKEQQWENFIQRQPNVSLDFNEALNGVEVFIRPVYEAILREREFFGRWNPIDRQWEKTI